MLALCLRVAIAVVCAVPVVAPVLVACVVCYTVCTRYGDVLLAYEMNDKPLPPEHGGPLRIIVPGHVGIRNIKWVQEIQTSPDEVSYANARVVWSIGAMGRKSNNTKYHHVSCMWCCVYRGCSERSRSYVLTQGCALCLVCHVVVLLWRCIIRRTCRRKGTGNGVRRTKGLRQA